MDGSTTWDAYRARAVRKRTISLEDDDGKKKSQATVLIEIAERWDVFHDPDQAGYIVIDDDDARKVLPIRSTAFRRRLSGEYFKVTGKGCNGNAVSDALSTIEARAVFEAPEHAVYIRVARVADHIYLDMCDERWRAIEVSPDGWRIVDTPPVFFVRKNGMLALPTPTKGGSAADIREFLNIHDDQLELVIGWMLGALRGQSPYPVLVLQGEQGTGKSTTSRVLRSFVDPSTTPLRSPPKEPRDLLVSAINNHLVTLDNLSGLSPELSDCLCRLATGGGLDVRALYTDTDQVLVEIQRPVLVNGIDDIASRPDLSERSIILNLPVIDPTRRRAEKPFWAELNSAKPGIMGGLLDALSCALRHESSVNLGRMPRMADFAIWVTAAEPALGWPDGAFLERYDRMQDTAVIDGIEASPVGSALLDLLTDKEEWAGSPTALLRELELIAGNSAKSKAWPQSQKGLKNVLQRLAPSFRKIGITIDRGKDGCGNRFYKIYRAANYPPYPPYPPYPTDDAGSGTAHSTADSHSTAHNRRTTADSNPYPPGTKPSNDAGSGTYGTYGTYPGASLNPDLGKEPPTDLLPPCLSATPLQLSNHAAYSDFQSATAKNRVADSETLEPAPHKECSGVADKKAKNPDLGKWVKPAFRIVPNDRDEEVF
jgi:hypothetical protein